MLYFPLGSWVSRNKSLAEKGIQFKEIRNELIDEVWTSGNGRPARPSSVINALPIEFAGKTVPSSSVAYALLVW